MGHPSQTPISREQEQEITTSPMSLTHFEDRLLARNIISSVAIDKHQPLETVLNEVLHQTTKQVQIGAGRGRKRSWEIKMMIVQVMEDTGYNKVKTGWFSNWYASLKKDLGL